MHFARLPFARVVFTSLVVGAALQVPSAQTRPTAPLSGPAGQILTEPRLPLAPGKRGSTGAWQDNSQNHVLVGSTFGAVIPLGRLPWGGFVTLRFEAADVMTGEACSIKAWLVNKNANNGNGLEQMTYRFTGSGRTVFTLTRTGEGVMILQTQDKSSVCQVITSFRCCG